VRHSAHVNGKLPSSFDWYALPHSESMNMSPDVDGSIIGEIVALRLAVKRLLAYKVRRAEDSDPFLCMSTRAGCTKVTGTVHAAD